MSYDYNLDPSLPPDTNESPSLGASRIRSFKNFMQERFLAVFYGFDTSATETAVGAKQIPFVAQATAPGAVVDGVVTYAKDVNSSAELFIKNESDNDIQITSGTGVKSQVAYVERSSLTAYQAPKDGWIFGNGSTEVRLADNETLDSGLVTITVSGNFCFPVPKGKWFMLYGTAGQTFYFA